MTTKYLPPQRRDFSQEDFPSLGSTKHISVNNVWKKVDNLKETINNNNQKEIEDKIQRSKELKDFKQLYKSSQLLPKLHTKNNGDEEDEEIMMVDNDVEDVVEDIIDDNNSDSENEDEPY